MVGSESGDDLNEALAELEHREFLCKNGSEERAYTFCHVLVREAIYRTMLTHRRRELHLSVAHCLEKLHAGRLYEVLDSLSYHFDKASDPDQQMDLPYEFFAGGEDIVGHEVESFMHGEGSRN